MESWKHLVKKGEVEELSLPDQDVLFVEVFSRYERLLCDPLYLNELLVPGKEVKHLSDGFKEEFRKYCISLRLKKGAVMNVYQDVKNYHVVTVKGLIASKTKVFTKVDVPWFMGEMNSVMCEDEFYMPLNYNLDVYSLEDSACILISREQLNLLTSKYEEARNILVKAYELSLVKLDRRSKLRGLDADGRYNKVFNENPQLTSRIPSAELALHLGVAEGELRVIRDIIRDLN
ncbi:cyclic nucleotide-binding domain-containing protein [Chitinophaga deserti]|uniref:hypothetical protein n=1 Tax=Chitinophaga deserti TaxID=2164099 RepID=UPI000D6B28A6|nr:hypothetical protein [Chitinophaga deserti]